MSGAHHWPRESGWRKTMQDNNMESSWRVVITVANSNAPCDLMVYVMKN